MKNSNSIYKIVCKNCILCYVAMTCQYLLKRIYQHKYNISKNENYIALSTHTLETGHIFYFDSTQILAFESNRFKREILENIYIFVNNTVNFKKDFNASQQGFIEMYYRPNYYICYKELMNYFY